MVNIILASHGEFAPGILQSLSMLFGEQKNMRAISLMPGEKMEEFKGKMLEAIEAFEDPENVLIFVDLIGGTPYNVSKKLLEGHEDTWALVSGINFPMLISATVACMRKTATAQSVAASVLKDSREGIRVFPESLEA